MTRIEAAFIGLLFTALGAIGAYLIFFQPVRAAHKTQVWESSSGVKVIDMDGVCLYQYGQALAVVSKARLGSGAGCE